MNPARSYFRESQSLTGPEENSIETDKIFTLKPELPFETFFATTATGLGPVSG